MRPEIIRTTAGTVLYLPIVVDGTGVYNDSEYYLRNAGVWEAIDGQTWTSDLKSRLPPDLEIHTGVWPDLRAMRAEAGLYRPGDAGCCPSGGTARMSLAIRGRQLVIDSLVIERAPRPVPARGTRSRCR